MADDVTLTGKSKRKSPKRDTSVALPPSSPLSSGADWSKDPLVLEMANDLAILSQEIYAFKLGTLGPNPTVLDVEAAEKLGYVCGSLAPLGTYPPLAPIQGPEPAPPQAPQPTERRTRRTRRALTVKQ